jgi:putative MATE family efflux protein
MRRSYDLTVGPISSHFRTLAVPAAVGLVFSTLYNVVNVYFAGLLDTRSQAGLAVAFQVFYLLPTVGIGLGTALSALIGAAIGRKDPGVVRLLAAQGISYGLIAAIVLMVVGLCFGQWLIEALSEPGGYREAANSYFTLLLLSVPGFVLAFGLNGILQAQGDAVTMQYALFAAFLANIALSPLLIFGVPGIWQGIGFNGIALATVVSQSGVAVCVIWRVFRSDIGGGLKLSDFRPEVKCYRQITAQLVPTSSAMIVLIASGFVIQFYLKTFGQSAVAAYGVAIRIEQLFLLPVFGLTSALLPIAAQNFGAGETERVRQALFGCWKFGLVYMCIACPLLWFTARWMMEIFTDAPDVVRMGVSYLHVDGVILPAYMLLFSINSFLQALGKPIWVLWIGLYRQALAITIFVWIFVDVLDFGLWGVWYGIVISVMSGLAFSLVVTHSVARSLIGPLWKTRPAQAANEAAHGSATERNGNVCLD